MKRFYCILLLVGVVTVLAVIGLYSIAMGQTTVTAVIENGEVVIYEIAKTKKEVICLPKPELDISEENAKKVCEAETKSISITEEIDKKINFWAFPFAKTATLVKKEISYDPQNGWRNEIVVAKKITEEMRIFTGIIIGLFFSYLFLSCAAQRNHINKSYDEKTQFSFAQRLVGSYLFIIAMCSSAISCFMISNHTLFVMSVIATFIFGFCAWSFVTTVFNTQENLSFVSECGAVFGGIIFVILNTILAIVSADYNSAKEFMAILLLMMAISFIIGWLSVFGKMDAKLKEAKEEKNPNTNSSL